ncbi:MAG: SpoIVB peptidase S55 domain-containing protein, partial [Acidobacteriota bacterium]
MSASASFTLLALAAVVFLLLPSSLRAASAAASSAITAAIPVAPIETLGVDKVTPGMKGYGVSDLGDGKGIQRFEVQILGVMKRYAPRQDLILARVTGAGLENSGIIAGMSGSPIYVEGRLVGALAYGWPFSKDAICGITPIQSMLDIRHVPASPPVPIGGSSPAAKVSAAVGLPAAGEAPGLGGGSVTTASFLEAFSSGHFRERMDDLLKPLRAAPADGMAALPIPVSLSGVAPGGKFFERVADAAGWMAAPSGASAPASGKAPTGPDAARLFPGSAVAAQLLSGDMDLAATGTV